MWKYTLRDLTEEDDPETWARALATEGWRMWPRRTGVLIELHGRTVRRYSLRRWAGPGEPPEDAAGRGL